MKLTIVVHEAGEGGYWAEVPAIAGCVSQGESLGELLENIREAIEGCLSVNASDIPVSDRRDRASASLDGDDAALLIEEREPPKSSVMEAPHYLIGRPVPGPLAGVRAT